MRRHSPSPRKERGSGERKHRPPRTFLAALCYLLFAMPPYRPNNCCSRIAANITTPSARNSPASTANPRSSYTAAKTAAPAGPMANENDCAVAAMPKPVPRLDRVTLAAMCVLIAGTRAETTSATSKNPAM